MVLITAFSAVEGSWNSNSSNNNSDNNSKYLGNKSYGWAEKEEFGNLSSEKTIVLITGVHPRESGFHNATSEALKNISSSLSKKYILYKIHVTKSPNHFTIGRMNGQLITYNFVVPDVIKIKPELAVDIHEDLWTEAGYKYPRFIYPISKDNETKNIINSIANNMTFLKIYSPGGSSPAYVTKPIAKAGINAMVYETYKKDSYQRKYDDAVKFLEILDKL